MNKNYNKIERLGKISRKKEKKCIKHQTRAVTSSFFFIFLLLLFIPLRLN